jgi:L-ascorbate metabolism protein UlaG (beta-lactamase superfamily)
MTSDHFDGKRFFNPMGPALQPFSAVPRMLLSRRTRWPRRIADAPQPFPRRDNAAAAVTFVGHATFLIQTPAGNILTDPVFSERAGPWGLVGPRRVRRPAIPLDSLPRVSTILLSHNHYDHCDLRTLRALARRFDPVVITALGNAPLLRSAGVKRIEELDWWQHTTTMPFSVTLTPAHHFSARGPWDRNRALWGGFVIRIAARRIYFAGDTDYAPFLGDVRERLGPIDLALLPIGAYEPRWFMQSVHMNPKEAVRAHLELGAGVSIAMHFGTFQLTTEGIDEPIRALEQARAAQQLSASAFRTLAFGETAYLVD